MASYIQAQNQFQTLTLIGKDVEAQSNLLSVTNGVVDTTSTLEVTENCKIQLFITDGNGNQVRMYDWGMTEAGTYSFEWDGKDSNGAKVADGAYQFQVTATNAAGETMTEGITPAIHGRVSSVSFDETGQPIIHIGHIQISLSQVMEILQSDSSASSGDSSSSSSSNSSSNAGGTTASAGDSSSTSDDSSSASGDSSTSADDSIASSGEAADSGGDSAAAGDSTDSGGDSSGADGGEA
jgi:hypothetical protein